MAGKGDKRRPTDEKKYKDNWDRIWGDKSNEKENNKEKDDTSKNVS